MFIAVLSAQGRIDWTATSFNNTILAGTIRMHEANWQDLSDEAQTPSSHLAIATPCWGKGASPAGTGTSSMRSHSRGISGARIARHGCDAPVRNVLAVHVRLIQLWIVVLHAHRARQTATPQQVECQA